MNKLIKRQYRKMAF